MSYTFKSKEELNEAIKTNNDPAFLNAVISKEVQIIPDVDEVQEPVDGSLDDETEGVDVIQNDIQPVVETPVMDAAEIERQKKYLEFQYSQSEEKIKALQEKNERLQAEKRAEAEAKQKNEELVREYAERLKNAETKTINKISPDENGYGNSEDDDDAYASEYSKENRKRLEEIRQKLELSKNPEMQEVLSKLELLERKQREKDDEEAEYQKRREAKRQHDATMSEINEFQYKYSELKTKEPVDSLYKKWLKFREDISAITGVQDTPTLESKINDYMSGGETRKIAEARGIAPVPDYDKLQVLINLLDLKNGEEYDPNLGKMKDITDSYGNKVRYRNLEDAYKISKYYDDMNEARIKTHREIQQKLSQFDNAATTIGGHQTQSHNDIKGQISEEKQILKDFWTDPRKYANDIPAYKRVSEIAKKHGVLLPDLSKYRR